MFRLFATAQKGSPTVNRGPLSRLEFCLRRMAERKYHFFSFLSHKINQTDHSSANSFTLKLTMAVLTESPLSNRITPFTRITPLQTSQTSIHVPKNDFSGPAITQSYPAILFDMDGTIIDSTNAITKYWEKSASSLRSVASH
jgi:hypothetical protein